MPRFPGEPKNRPAKPSLAQVGREAGGDGGIVLNGAGGAITQRTKQAANFIGFMAMIYGQSPNSSGFAHRYIFGLSANRAHSILFAKHAIVRIQVDTELKAKHSIFGFIWITWTFNTPIFSIFCPAGSASILISTLPRMRAFPRGNPILIS
jgi:hypothetical protein